LQALPAVIIGCHEPTKHPRTPDRAEPAGVRLMRVPRLIAGYNHWSRAGVVRFPKIVRLAIKGRQTKKDRLRGTALSKRAVLPKLSVVRLRRRS